MTVNSAAVDPYRPAEGRYECLACGNRFEHDDPVSRCPACDGDVRNIAVPRE